MIVIIIYRELIGYGIAQARGQIAIMRNTVPIEDIMNGPAPDSVKVKIQVIQDVKNYAESIGLVPTENYSTYYDQKGRSVLWNVSACQPFAFEPKEWTFPFLGSFAYKGFFDLEKAKEEEAILRSEGYDTNIRSVGAWSTLGWFKDPILSNMLNRPKGDLAELIFHELTHGTIFVRDSLEFNENLASFIGEKATVQFLTDRYGENSNELKEYEMGVSDARKFRSHLLRGRSYLDSLYQSFPSDSPVETRAELKSEMINSIVEAIDTIDFYQSYYYEIFKNRKPNNAYFMSFKRYYSYKEDLQSLFERQGGDISKFITYCRSEYDD